MFIGIDLGTSSVKTVLIDSNQKILSTAYSNLTVRSPKDGYNEQDPTEWIKATEICLQTMRNNCPIEFSATISIGISGHMHGATCLDSNHQVIRPCILWNDTRSHQECEEIMKDAA